MQISKTYFYFMLLGYCWFQTLNKYLNTTKNTLQIKMPSQERQNILATMYQK